MKYWEYYEELYIVHTCERPDIVLDEIVQDFDHRFPNSKNRSISIDICEWTLDPKFIAFGLLYDRERFYSDKGYDIDFSF